MIHFCSTAHFDLCLNIFKMFQNTIVCYTPKNLFLKNVTCRCQNTSILAHAREHPHGCGLANLWLYINIYSAHPSISPHRLVVRTSRRGRDNPSSTPGVANPMQCLIATEARITMTYRVDPCLPTRKMSHVAECTCPPANRNIARG